VKTIKLMMIDKDMTTCEIEVNAFTYKSLGIDYKKAKIHLGKRELNVTLSEWLERMNDGKNKTDNKNDDRV